MVTLSLKGTLSYIDPKTGHLKMYFIDTLDWSGTPDDTRAKLTNYGDNTNARPIQGDYFTVTLPYKNATPDIIAMCGHQVKIMARVQNYSFISRAPRNRGERITGFKLVMEDIKKIKPFEQTQPNIIIPCTDTMTLQLPAQNPED